MLRLLAVTLFLGLCACDGVGGDGKCLLRAETQADGSVLFIDAMSGKSIATCDAPITTCVLTNGVAVDAGMMRAWA